MKKYGFTIIEVLVVLAIVALIAVVATPLSRDWMRDANRLETEAQLTQAIGRAKAASLRNKMAATGDSPVTAVCRSDTNLITVREGVSGTAPNCSTSGGTQIWQAQISTNVTIKVNGSALNCLCFSNKGLTTSSTPCSACATSTIFTLDAGTGGTPPTVAIY